MKLPLYYTGLKGKATVQAADGSRRTYSLDSKGNLHLPVSIPSETAAWFLIEE